MMKSGMIFDITRNSYVDGPGIRTTVFFKGCNLRCRWCHNPESQRRETELLFYHSKCTGCGKCVEKCPHHAVADPSECQLCGICALYCPHDARRICGKSMTSAEILHSVLKDKPFYASSGGGVTFSGGECLLQPDFLTECLALCQENDLHTAVDTAGNVPFDSFEQVLPYCKLFLYDIKTFSSALHRTMTGVGNELILDNLRRLLARNASVWIRIPIIPSVNDTDAELYGIHDFLQTLPPVSKIELLPYHAMGDSKYLALGRSPIAYSVPSDAQMQHFRAIFSDLT